MKSNLRNMLVVLTGIAAIMGAALALVHQVTAEPIRQAEIDTKNTALARVLPSFDNDPSTTVTEITLEGDNRPVKVYTATLGGRPCGIAVESWTLDGFSGEITVMVGFDNDGILSGYKVLQHAETPGLGAKADTWFCDSTANRSVIGSAEPLSVAKDGGQIDGITAATITSRAFLDAINRARRAYNHVMK